MQIIGLCRFSYPCVGGFQIEHETIEQRISYLYSEERLSERLFAFEHITLPGLRAQTDNDFTFVVLIGESMPEHHTERLLAMVEDIPQVVVLSYEPMEYRNAMRRVFAQAVDTSFDWVVQFRLDDDDAVSVDFIQRVRRNAILTEKIYKETGKLAIDFNQGYAVELTNTGIMAAHLKRAYWTPALAVVLSTHAGKNIMNFPHHIIHTLMPTLTRNESNMFLRGINDHNDSSFIKHLPPREPLDPLTQSIFKLRFGIDANKVSRAINSSG